MSSDILNIREFKFFCEYFGISFIDTDDRQTRDMNVKYKVDSQIVIDEFIPVDFIHSVNYCKVDIGDYECLGIHCEASTQWQSFRYNNKLRELLVTGTSRKYGHKYEISISHP